MRIRSDLICEVTAVERVTGDIIELTLFPVEDDSLEFNPGQYVLLEDEDYRVPPRSYSIANAPRPDGMISLLVTRVAGGQLTAWVHDRLKTGDRVSVSGPYGTFTDESTPDDDSPLVGDSIPTGETPEADRPSLFLAAGSGLAPIRSLIEARLAGSTTEPSTLIFSARTEADVIDREHFSQLAVKRDEFRFIRTVTRGQGPGPHGRIPTLIEPLCGNLSKHRVFIAGSPGFVTDCAAAATAAGASPVEVRTEVFFVEPQPWVAGAP